MKRYSDRNLALKNCSVVLQHCDSYELRGSILCNEYNESNDYLFKGFPVPPSDSVSYSSSSGSNYNELLTSPENDVDFSEDDNSEITSALSPQDSLYDWEKQCSPCSVVIDTRELDMFLSSNRGIYSDMNVLSLGNCSGSSNGFYQNGKNLEINPVGNNDMEEYDIFPPGMPSPCSPCYVKLDKSELDFYSNRDGCSGKKNIFLKDLKGACSPCSVALWDVRKSRIDDSKRQCSNILKECLNVDQVEVKKCYVVLEDILEKVQPIKSRLVTPLSDIALLELTSNDFLTSDHINKFSDILSKATCFNPVDVLLMWVKEDIKPLRANTPHIQILPAAPTSRVTHWVCTFFNGSVIRVFDSANKPLTRHQEEFLFRLFPSKPEIVHEEVQRQPNNYDCGVFAIAFAVSLALGRDPTKERFIHSSMRSHLLAIFDTRSLKPFPSKCHRNTLSCPLSQTFPKLPHLR